MKQLKLTGSIYYIGEPSLDDLQFLVNEGFNRVLAKVTVSGKYVEMWSKKNQGVTKNKRRM